MNKFRLIIIILSIAGMIATFLPWAHGNIPVGESMIDFMTWDPEERTVYWTAGDWYISMFLFAVVLIMMLLWNRKYFVKWIPLYVAYFFSIIIVAFWFRKITDFHNRMDTVNEMYQDEGAVEVTEELWFEINLGSGIYTLTGSWALIFITLIVATIISKNEGEIVE